MSVHYSTGSTPSWMHHDRMPSQGTSNGILGVVKEEMISPQHNRPRDDSQFYTMRVAKCTTSRRGLTPRLCGAGALCDTRR
jgi:hypothetical protein